MCEQFTRLKSWQQTKKKKKSKALQKKKKKVSIYHRIKHKDYVGFHILRVLLRANAAVAAAAVYFLSSIFLWNNLYIFLFKTCYRLYKMNSKMEWHSISYSFRRWDIGHSIYIYTIKHLISSCSTLIFVSRNILFRFVWENLLDWCCLYSYSCLMMLWVVYCFFFFRWFGQYFTIINIFTPREPIYNILP